MSAPIPISGAALSRLAGLELAIARLEIVKRELNSQSLNALALKAGELIECIEAQLDRELKRSHRRKR